MTTNNDVGRAQLVIQLAGLLLTVATAAGVTYVKHELAETRILIMEKISLATQNLIQRQEFDSLERRVYTLEKERR